MTLQLVLVVGGNTLIEVRAHTLAQNKGIIARQSYNHARGQSSTIIIHNFMEVQHVVKMWGCIYIPHTVGVIIANI